MVNSITIFLNLYCEIHEMYSCYINNRFFNVKTHRTESRSVPLLLVILNLGHLYSLMCSLNKGTPW